MTTAWRTTAGVRPEQPPRSHYSKFLLRCRNICHPYRKTLASGFAKLGSQPSAVAIEAIAGRKYGRSMEKRHRRTLAELFRGGDYMNLLKRREIYQHLDRAGGRLEHCANTCKIG